MARTPGRFCAVKTSPVSPPRARPGGYHRVPGTRWALTCGRLARQKRISLPPSPSVLGEAGETLRTIVFLAHADPAMPDVPDAHLSSLHGLALEIRRDNDVSSLSFFVFFCCCWGFFFVLYFFFLHEKKKKKRLDPTDRGVPRWERRGGRARHSALLRDPGEEAATQNPRALEAVGAEQP